MPRFRITSNFDNTDDPYEPYDEFDQFDRPPAPRKKRPRFNDVPRVVLEGKSGRTAIDVDTAIEPGGTDISAAAADLAAKTYQSPADKSPVDQSPADAPFSSYDVATRGPGPIPDWLVTSLSARDTRLGTIKSGKEADVGLLDRSLPGGPGCLLAVKTFRSGHHRSFHRDAGYREGRRVRRSRETRAMAARSGFGRDLLTGQWATAEFGALSAMWRAGARVPYPVQLIGPELMMEFIGEPDGTAAPRLAAFDADTADFSDLWHDLVRSLEVLAEAGLTHGDLSPYNVLVTEAGCVLIDLPQVVDLVANPMGEQFLRRDCRNIAGFFARRGVLAADPETLALHLAGLALP